MTPNAIEILIHCHVSPEPHPRLAAPAVGEEIRSFLRNGLIESDNTEVGAYRTTERGKAHIAQLCSIAWPKPAWIGEDGQIIDMEYQQP